MTDYMPIKKSQAFLVKSVPLFIKNAKGEFLLYKSENLKLDNALYDDGNLPELFIHIDDKALTTAEIQKELNIALYSQIRKRGLHNVKKILNGIVKEALKHPFEGGLAHLPETIDLIFDGCLAETRFLRDLADIASRSYSIVEHSANVMIFTMNLGIYLGMAEDDAKQLSLSALLHDIGKAQLPEAILEANHRLSDAEFDANKKHTLVGYDIIRQCKAFGDATALGALEHHERLDGSGYPMGITKVSRQGQIIGIINSFEYLSFREKAYRKAQKPFDAMSHIKNEVLNEGKFSRDIFIDLCKSLG